MDVRLTPEQVALRDSAAQAVDRLAAKAVGELDDAERTAKLDAAVVASGWRELRAPNDDGEPWASAVEVAIVAEEFGRGLADAPLLGPTLATELRRLAGAPAATSHETVALTTDLAAVVLPGPADGAPASLAIEARGASSALAAAPAGDGYDVVALAVDGDPTGPDLTRPSVALGAGTAVDAVTQGASITEDKLLKWTALGLAVSSADLVGTMRGAIQLTTEYAGQRRQYGVAIGSFQAVQHLLADACVSLEGASSAALHAAWAVDALPPSDAVAAASVAKAYCARAARSVCETAIQVHGGIGNTWECLAHVYLRRALLSADVLGGIGPSLSRVLEHRGIGD